MYKIYTHLYIYMEPVVLDPWIVTPRQSAGKRKPGFQYIIYIYIYKVALLLFPRSTSIAPGR